MEKRGEQTIVQLKRHRRGYGVKAQSLVDFSNFLEKIAVSM